MPVMLDAHRARVSARGKTRRRDTYCQEKELVKRRDIRAKI